MEYPKLVSWTYYPSQKIFGKTTKEMIKEIYVTNKGGEQEITDNTFTFAMNMFIDYHSPYIKIVERIGFTSKGKSYGVIYKKMKEKYPWLENKLSVFQGMIKDCGNYIFLDLKYICSHNYKNVFSLDDLVKSGNWFYIKKERLVVDLIEKIINFIPRSVMGGEIKEYQEVMIPRFLLEMKLKFPEIYSKISKQTDSNVEKSFIGKKALLPQLKPEKVKFTEMLFMPSVWDYDGEYLTTTKKEGNYEVEIRVKVTDIMKCTIIDESTVDLSKLV